MAVLHVKSPNGTIQSLNLSHLDVGMNFTTGNGQVIFHGKFIMQSCSGVATPWNGVQTATFPIVFPHGIFCILTCEYYARLYYDQQIGSISGINIGETDNAHTIIYTVIADNAPSVHSANSSTWVLAMGY